MSILISSATRSLMFYYFLLSRWVDAHNYYRACHGSPPLRWAPELLPPAKAWAPWWEEVLTSTMEDV